MGRRARRAVLCAAALVAVATVVQFAQVADQTVDVQILAINDFHGALEPASGGTGRIGSTPAGGIEYLAAHLARLRTTNPNTVVVGAGDNIGATPLLSSLSHDEPTIEALTRAGLQLSAVGNHELDKGWWELLRMQNGGCHPVDGCRDGAPFEGAGFTYLAANITLDPRLADTNALELAGVRGSEPRPLVPGYAVHETGGVPVGFIGLILQDAPSVVLPASVRGLRFGPEAEAANEAARALRERGVRAIVVLMHAGGEHGGGINACSRVSGGLADLVNRMSEDIDVVVSGHTHQAYNCTIGGKLVTSAASGGRLVTDIDLRLRRSDGEVVFKRARNLVVTRDVPPDPAQAALLAHYRPIADKVGARVVGSIRSSLLRSTSDAGESSLGNVIADALFDAANRMPGGGADVAFWNLGGIRADLVARTGPAPTPVTFAELFAVLPFGNELIIRSLSGEELIQALEQQFGPSGTRVLQVSRGFSYSYDPSRPRGRRIDPASIRLDGAPLDPTRRYRVATSNFLWDTGDGFGALAAGTDPVTVGVDVELVAEYFFHHSPIAPAPQNRIRRIR